MKKNYKPRSCGAVYKNKIMAKKRNVMKQNWRRNRNAMNNIVSSKMDGLGKLGLDGLTFGMDGDKQREVIPMFSPGYSLLNPHFQKDLKPKAEHMYEVSEESDEEEVEGDEAESKKLLREKKLERKKEEEFNQEL
jgi:hypothetical protein